jgi:pup-ligase protein
MKMLMGGETEYAMSARHQNGRAFNQELLLQRFLEHARMSLGYTSNSMSGRFLSNGGLLYLDAGLHIEWATPECTSPFDVVRYLNAGDRIVHGLAASLETEANDVVGVFCSRTNIDYLSGTLWAAHESYMHTGTPQDLPAALIPFLASRVILGAGGWDYRAFGLRFTLSPRAHFINRVCDRDSQHLRPLFHTKNETLSGVGSHRLHVACSESLCSHTANVVRFGSTALVLWLATRGVRAGDYVALASPVSAVQRFARDPKWEALGAGEQERWLSAVEIQRHYLQLIEANLYDRDIPEWAERVCGLWRHILDGIDAADGRLDCTMDWAIKRRLFERLLARRGVSWASLPVWDGVLTRLHTAWVRAGGKTFEPLKALDWSELADTRSHLAQSLARHGLSWDQLSTFLTARNEVLEADAKFGGLDATGIFNALDAAGVLQHRVEGLDIGDAVTDPPHDTRARVRGNVVRRLSDEGVPYGAEWVSVYDGKRSRILDLSNPFETEERWRERTENLGSGI